MPLLLCQQFCMICVEFCDPPERCAEFKVGESSKTSIDKDAMFLCFNVMIELDEPPAAVVFLVTVPAETWRPCHFLRGGCWWCFPLLGMPLNRAHRDFGVCGVFACVCVFCAWCHLYPSPCCLQGTPKPLIPLHGLLYAVRPMRVQIPLWS